MDDSGLRRRDFLAAASGGCIAIAGCADETADRTGYGSAYGRSYGGE